MVSAPPKTILVRAPNWIGDQILAYPFYYYLRAAYPRAQITIACLPWVEAVQFRNLVDAVHVLPRADRPGLRARFETAELAASELKAIGPWDVAYCLPNSLSSAWIQYRAGAKERRGYALDGRGWLLQPGLSWEKRHSMHRSEDYVGLLPAEFQPKKKPVREFWGVPPENDLDPGIPGVVQRFDPQAAWPGTTQTEPPQEPYWVLAPGSQAESRRWPLEAYAALAREILSSRGWRGVIVGGPAEASAAMQLTSDRSIGLIDLTARGSVASNAKIFEHAKFTVSNDSGLAHVAALCGSPVQVVWGAGDPKHTEPLGPGRVRVIFNPVECWPCERNFCQLPEGRKIECLRGIQPDAVWKEIQSGIRPH
jgi:lipopolysaccharide heptosyltransferase II